MRRRYTLIVHTYECGDPRKPMREVRLHYSAAAIVNSSLNELLEVVDRITLVASLFQEGQGDWIRQVYDVVLKEGKSIEEISGISFMELESHFHSRRVNGYEVHTLMAKNHHELGRIGSVIVDAVVMPDSVIGSQGATLLLRGAPSGVKSMVEGFKLWKEPTRISVVEQSQESGEEMISRISEHQSKVFIAAHTAGYFENPRRISLVELSHQLDLSRSTVAGHLRSIEMMMANGLMKSLRKD